MMSKTSWSSPAPTGSNTSIGRRPSRRRNRQGAQRSFSFEDPMSPRITTGGLRPLARASGRSDHQPGRAVSRVRGVEARRAPAARGAPSRAFSSAAALVCVVALSVPRSAAAQQDGRDAHDLRLGTLYDAAQRANPRIAAAGALADAAAARVPGAGLPPDPQVQLGLLGRALPGLGPMEVLGMTQLQLVQRWPLAGKLGFASAAAVARGTAARERAVDVGWEVRGRVAAAFYELYRTERGAEIALATRRLMEDIAATADAMYRVGEAGQADVLKARVEVARMTEEITAMRAMRLVNLSRLSGLLDQPIDSTTGPAVLPVLPAILPSADELMRRATASRPMVRAGEADFAAASAEESRVRREIWPDLEIGIQYAQRGSPTGTDHMGSLMLGASVPVFARSRQLRMRDEAGAMRAMAAADLAAMRAETRARVGEAYVEWVRARNLAALYRTTILPQAGAAVTASLAAYRVGRVNLMTLIDNQVTVNRYARELAALEAAEGTALADLEMFLGRQLFDPQSGRPASEGGR